MSVNPRLTRLTTCLLTFALVATLASAPSASAGPISELLARRRQEKQMKLPPIDKPFSKKPVRDLNQRNVSLTQKFKQRFDPRQLTARIMRKDKIDPGLMKTSN